MMLLDATDKLIAEVIELCLGVSGGFPNGVWLILITAKIVLMELQLEEEKNRLYHYIQLLPFLVGVKR